MAHGAGRNTWVPGKVIFIIMSMAVRPAGFLVLMSTPLLQTSRATFGLTDGLSYAHGVHWNIFWALLDFKGFAADLLHTFH